MVKLSAKKLAKKLSPETLLRIERDELDAVAIMHALIYEALSYNPLSQSVGAVERFFIENSGGEKANIVEIENAIKFDALINLAVPGKGQSYDELRFQLMRAYGRGAEDHFTARHLSWENFRFSDDEMMKSAFDRACGEYQSKIVRKCYGGKKKDFKRNCKAFRVPLADFSSIVKMLYEQALENHPFKEIAGCIPELYKIAEQIKSQTVSNDLVCWECLEVKDCKHVCSGCLVARYCGIACQKKAWNGGHKITCEVACPSIKEMYQNQEKNHDVVKAALADPEKHERKYGFRPNYRIDSLLMWNPFQQFVTDSDEEHFELPSMEQFYRNLSQVKNGTLWCDRPFARPDIEAANSLEFNDNDGLEQVVRSGLALSYQYPECSPDGTIEDLEHRNSQFHSNWLTGNSKLEHNVSSNCTAAEFLKAYSTWEHPQSFDRIFRDFTVSQGLANIRAYDKIVGNRGLSKKVREKVLKKKQKVHAELLERHLEK